MSQIILVAALSSAGGWIVGGVSLAISGVAVVVAWRNAHQAKVESERAEHLATFLQQRGSEIAEDTMPAAQRIRLLLGLKSGQHLGLSPERQVSTIRYQRGRLSAAEVQEMVDEVLDGLRASKDLDALAASSGTSADEVRAMDVKITESGEGLDPVASAIVVQLMSGASAASNALFWKTIIMPRVRKVAPSDAIGAEAANRRLS